MPEETQTTVPAPPAKKAKKAKKVKHEMRLNAAGKPVMRIKIYAPFKVYYDQDAESISGENETGPFDILPRHKNFMTLLSPCELTVRNAGQNDYKIKITRAIMHIKADMITIFLDV